MDLAVGLGLLNRDELPRNEWKYFDVLHYELKVLGLI
jgi:hypothetical protein